MALVDKNTKTNTRIVIGRDGLPRKDRFKDLIQEIQEDTIRNHVVIVCESKYERREVFHYLLENLSGVTKKHVGRLWVETATHRIETKVVYERESFRGHQAMTHKYLLIGDAIYHEFKESYLKVLVAPSKNPLPWEP